MTKQKRLWLIDQYVILLGGVEKAADTMGVTVQTIYRWIAGKREISWEDFDKLEKLADEVILSHAEEIPNDH